MKRHYHYDIDQTLAEVHAILDGREFSRVPAPEVVAWFAWSALAAAGEWA